jgi:hypothetical protein
MKLRLVTRDMREPRDVGQAPMVKKFAPIAPALT